MYSARNELPGTFPGLFFEMRENAEEFAEYLKRNLSNMLRLERNGKSIKGLVEDYAGFMRKWIKCLTVRNMLNALDKIDARVNDNTNNIGFKSGVPLWNNITFQFYSIGSDGKEGGNIYLKMNGRGRPLDYFENLKAFMDGKMENATDESFLSEWRRKMDNEWEKFFYSVNKSDGKPRPEEINGLRMKFFFCLIFIWVCLNKKGDDLLERIRNYEEIPIYYLEKSEIFNSADIFKFVSVSIGNIIRCRDEGLDTVGKVFSYASNSECAVVDVPGLSSSNVNKSVLLDLIDNNNAEYRMLAYFYAVASMPCCCKDANDFAKWIRICRNIIENVSGVDADNICSILKAINTLGGYVKEDIASGFYPVLLERINENDFIGELIKGQIREELAKLNWLEKNKSDSDGLNALLKFENYELLMGKISALSKDGLFDNDSLRELRGRFELLKLICNDNDEYRFPKVLISHLDDGAKLNGDYCLKRNPANYKKLLYGLCLEAFRKAKDNSISENLRGNRSSGKEEDDRNDWRWYLCCTRILNDSASWSGQTLKRLKDMQYPVLIAGSKRNANCFKDIVLNRVFLGCFPALFDGRVDKLELCGGYRYDAEGWSYVGIGSYVEFRYKDNYFMYRMHSSGSKLGIVYWWDSKKEYHEERLTSYDCFRSEQFVGILQSALGCS